MTVRIALEPVFVLHSRPYSNTSLIVELFSEQYGRVAALARSARGMKSRYKGKLQLFTPILASWSGRRELMSLGNIELAAAPYLLEGNALMCGFYLNELMMRLLHRDDPSPLIFQLYQETLAALAEAQPIEITLRRFEKNLLHYLGYGISLKHEAHSGKPIELDVFYQYIPERGFFRCDDVMATVKFAGRSLMALHQENFTDEQVLQDAKRLMRLILSDYLGAKPLKSREML